MTEEPHNLTDIEEGLRSLAERSPGDRILGDAVRVCRFARTLRDRVAAKEFSDGLRADVRSRLMGVDEENHKLRARVEELERDRIETEDGLSRIGPQVAEERRMREEAEAERDELQQKVKELEADLDDDVESAERLKAQLDAALAALKALQAASREVVSEALFMLRGGDDPAERCGECGLYGVGMFRDALKRLRDALTQDGEEEEALGEANREALNHELSRQQWEDGKE